MILWFLVKGLYFQNLRSEIFCLKISHAFGVKCEEKFFIHSLFAILKNKKNNDLGLFSIIIYNFAAQKTKYNENRSCKIKDT